MRYKTATLHPLHSETKKKNGNEMREAFPKTKKEYQLEVFLIANRARSTYRDRTINRLSFLSFYSSTAKSSH